MQLAQDQGHWELSHQRVNELRNLAAREVTRSNHPDSIAARLRGQQGHGSGEGPLDQGGGAPSSSGRGTQRKKEGHPTQAGGLPTSIGDQQVFGYDFLELGELLAYGGSCKVFHGMLDGEAVAVKVYHRTANAKDEMMQELTCYENLGQWLWNRCLDPSRSPFRCLTRFGDIASLGPLQGSSIPRVLASGFLDWSMDRFIAMTLQGPPLSSIGGSE